MAKPSRSKKASNTFSALAMSSLPPVSTDDASGLAEDWDVLDLRSLIAESSSAVRANDEHSGVRRVSDAELAELEGLTASAGLSSVFPPAPARKPSARPSKPTNPELAMIPEAPPGPPVPPDALAGLSAPSVLPPSLPAPPRAAAGASWGFAGLVLGAAAAVAVVYGGALLPNTGAPQALVATGQSTQAAVAADKTVAPTVTDDVTATPRAFVGGGPSVPTELAGSLAPKVEASLEKMPTELSAKPASVPAVTPVTSANEKAVTAEKAPAMLPGRLEAPEVQPSPVPESVESTVAVAEVEGETLAVAAAPEVTPALSATEAPASSDLTTAPADEATDADAVAAVEGEPSDETEVALTETPTERAASVDDLMQRALTKEAAPTTSSLQVKPMVQAVALPETPSRTDVRKALTALMPRLRTCAVGQTGMVTATIVVGGDGSVANASLSGPFSGSPVGECMTEVVKQAKFPAFERATFRVSYPFFIR